MKDLPLNAVSTSGIEIDHLLWALLAASAAIMGLVVGLLVLYAIRYRVASPLDRGGAEEKSWVIELGWTGATLVVFFGLFLWGADLYVRLYGVPDNAYKIYVVGKQWMWKLEYPDGQREINSLHVPIGRPIQLIMTSEDVIHDFSVPALRLKHDVLPGRYDTMWFQATEAGSYHLFCTQFCGTDHASMTGTVTVMSEPDFTQWLAEQENPGSMAELGHTIYLQKGCDGCHGGRGTAGAPPMARVSGVDRDSLHESILHPERRGAKGMPSFAGQIGEEDLLRLIAYIKSLAGEGEAK
jgi:cytochrome c oxidase subunit 2